MGTYFKVGFRDPVMKIRDRIVEAARMLADENPPVKITLASLSRASGVSWPTVRRYVDGKEGLPDFLQSVGAVSPTAPDAAGTPADSADTRTQILEAAFKTFSDKGYSGATLDDVAAVAGLTKGAIYWHFKGKDDLCMALIEDRFRSEAQRIPANIQDIIRGGGGEAALIAFVTHEVAQARDAEPYRRLGLEFMSRSRNPALRQRYAELAQNIYRDTIPVAQLLIENGVIAKDLDPKVVAFIWRCLLLGMGLWMNQDTDGADFEAMGPKLANLMWRGMAPENAPD
jgi:AcrR family transcriptional regulator